MTDHLATELVAFGVEEPSGRDGDPSAPPDLALIEFDEARVRAALVRVRRPIAQ
jgi:hypothetical protein